jgi:hypothetical protein
MLKAEERLRDAASELRRELARVPIPDPPTSRRIKLNWILAPALAVAAAVIVVFGVVPKGDPDPAVTSLPRTAATTLPPPTVTTTPPTTPQTTKPQTTTSLAVRVPVEGPIFGEETGVLLLLDDGIDGLAAFDPDRRLVARSRVDGQRAGDEPYSMIRVGDKLVVGWHEPHAVDISSREATSLGHATIFVPAAEPDRVWLINYPSGRIGGGAPLVWQVDMAGNTLTEPVTKTPGSGHPLIGIPGGLVLQRAGAGLSLWNLETEETTVLEADGTGFVHDVSGDELIWCSGDCTTLAMTNTSTLVTMEYELPAGYDEFQGRSSRISPSGRYLAALLGLHETYEGEAIWILDRDTGDITVVSDPETHVDYLAWAPDSDQLFATSGSYRQTRTAIWRYQISDGEFTAVVLPFGGALSPVVVDASAADAYIGADMVDPSQCRAPGVQPSGRTGICTFGL